MKKYVGKRVLKTGIAVSLSFFISSLFGLESSFSAVVSLIGLKETTQKTFRYGATLIFGSILSLVTGLLIVFLLGSSPLSFGLGTIIMISLLVSLKLSEGLVLSIVVMYHVLDNYPRAIGEFFFFSINELSLILIGISISVAVNILFPQKHNDFLDRTIDNIYKTLSDHLMLLSDNIVNPSCNAVSPASLEKLRKSIKKLIEKAELSKENILHENKKEHYNALIQKLKTLKKLIYMLEDMSKEANRLCEKRNHSNTISKALRLLSRIQRFPEQTTPSSYQRLFLSLNHLHGKFEESPLPSSRKEFEDRSALYHLYLNIMEYADELFLIKKYD